MRLVAIVGLLCLACRPAAALTCEEVRSYVQMYGESVVLAYAKSAGATPQQIRQGRACLDRGRAALKRRIGRVSAGAWDSSN